MNDVRDPRLLLVTGLSGAGKSTVLKVLEDLGWEVVDNLPVALFDALLDAPAGRGREGRPLAVGIDSRSRGFRPAPLVRRLKELRAAGDATSTRCSSTARAPSSNAAFPKRDGATRSPRTAPPPTASRASAR